MKNLRRSWHCRRLFFRYLRQRDKEKQNEKELYQQNVNNICSTTNTESEPIRKPIGHKTLLIIAAIIGIIVVGIILMCVFSQPKYTHKCVFSSYGTSTSTCQSIGETTYKCIYSTDKDIKCKKTKIVKDASCVPCKYVVKSTVYEKINQSKYISACTYCNKEKEEIVTHSSTQYKDKIGNWGVIGASNDDIKKKSTVYEFESIFYTNEEQKSNTITKYYILLKLYDNEGNWYATYYMQAHILHTKICYHTFKINDYWHRTKYYDHRWEISTIAPNNGTKLEYSA